MSGQTLAVALFGVLALGFGATVFRTSSMVRSALSLLGAMAAIGAMFLAMEAEFLGVLQLMMMAGEMSIMAIFMVMYMMDPGGLGKMSMVHQRRLSLVIGLAGGMGAVAVGLLADWGPIASAAPAPVQQVHDLGMELMGRSLLIFETAGVTILVAMVAATVVAIGGRTR